MTASETLIAPTANPLLERAAHDKLVRRHATSGTLGELEPLATRLALIRNSLKPRLRDPQLVIVAGDHGLAVEGLAGPNGPSTADEVTRILDARVPVTALAAAQGLALTVVDAGIAERLAAHDRLLIRKIAHGTRNTRITPAMSIDQAQAALRAGMEIGETLPGDAVACAGMGIGSEISAALVLSRLAGMQVHELLLGSSKLDASKHSRLAVLAQASLARHREASDPIEVLAAFGGFEIAMLAGLMLSSAQQRRVVMVDGLVACAALLVASRIAGAVTDYCLFCRSQKHLGLDAATQLFQSNPMLELALDSWDGCGAAMSWPLVRAASALLSDVSDDSEVTIGLMSLETEVTEPTSSDLQRALGGHRPKAEVSRRVRSHDEEPIGDTAQWHSPFGQSDSRENVAASARIDTQAEPRSGD